MTQMEKAKSLIESEVLSERKQRADLETHAAAQLTHYQQQISALNETIANTSRERDASNERCTLATTRIQQLVDSSSAKQTEFDELTTEYRALQTKHRSLLEAEHTLSVQCEKYKTESESLTKELQSVTATLESERTGVINSQSNSAQGWSTERATLRALIVRIEHDLNTKTQQFSTALNTLKADKLKYKKMAQLLQIKLTHSQRLVFGVAFCRILFLCTASSPTDSLCFRLLLCCDV